MGSGVLGQNVKTAQDAYSATLSDAQKWSMSDAQRLAMMQAIYNEVEDWVYGLVGVMQPYAGITIPSGWLLCDGSSLLRTGTYANLFAAITKTDTVTISITSPGVVSLNAHGRLTGDCISFETTGALPTGLSVGTNYFVIYKDANSFWVATTYANALSGTKINTSGSQSGVQTCRYNPNGIADATHFNIPDMVGAVPRGSGLSTGYTANVTVNQGHKDDDNLETHSHNVYGTLLGGVVGRTVSGTLGDATYNTLHGAAKELITGRNGTETKMKNVGVQFIIKY